MDREQLKKEEQDLAAGEKKDDAEQLSKREKGDDEKDSAEYGATLLAMSQIMSESPTFDSSLDLSPEIVEALESLYAAKCAIEESVGDGHVSGLERMKSLNLALAKLRPILSTGLEPGKDDGARELLGDKVTELRHEIKQTIYKEAVPRNKGEEEEEEEDDADEDDPDNEDGK